MANGNSYLGLASRAKELNVGENSQAELDASARAGFTTSEEKVRLFSELSPSNLLKMIFDGSSFQNSFF